MKTHVFKVGYMVRNRCSVCEADRDDRIHALPTDVTPEAFAAQVNTVKEGIDYYVEDINDEDFAHNLVADLINKGYRIVEERVVVIPRKQSLEALKKMRAYIVKKTGVQKRYRDRLWWIDQYINEEESNLPHD